MAETTAASSASPFIKEIAPITCSDEELRTILDEAELPPMLPALAYATGDMSLLRENLRPDPLLFAMPQGGLTDEQQAEVRAIAFEVLTRFRDGGCEVAPTPAEADVVRIMEYAVGGADMGAYVPLLEEELAHRGEDRRAPTWTNPGLDFKVLIIGAGMSGLLAAHRLQQANVDFTIYEKNDDVGGTWYENQYPGCRVDNPNHNYSYSFAQRHDWPYHFSTQPVLHEYFRDIAEVFELRKHIEFEHEVVSATWDDASSTWTVVVQGPDGTQETVEANAVISAVGQLNRPNYPTSIEGFGDFEGPAFHSARWRHDVDLTGKRVAVIGTGASAMQLIPEIAPVVGELLVFQRTPAWMGPTPEYHETVPEGLKWLYGHVPSYAEWNRFCIFWRMGDGSIANVTVDPEWMEGEGAKGESISMMNEFMRQLLIENFKLEFEGRPDLLEACTPHYPPGAKRMIRDNSIWATTLKRDNVRLLDGGGIQRITPKGIVTADGTEEVVDVIIYGTGFTASKFLTPMKVIGRDGVDLHEHWAGDARAYLGVTIAGFPNLFCLYGPNTNIVVNGSIVYFSECGVRLIMGLLGFLLADGRGKAIDVRRDVHDEFNEKVDAENGRMAWGVSTVNSWYKNEHGHVAQNWPFTLLEYWDRTAHPSADDYSFA
ncbi:MAG: 4-hydroxyacetophenone monooxygenase [Actinomycetota bacterium]|jgi:4-hydroxyacetophenone monooxygenase|nr:4-hydroxyacetophenone monooxygenase [Actinomycetota bacterium]